jgi:ribose 5-phosphate isomerase A
MNLKQEAAKRAVTFINNHSAVGLGAGATMAYMVEFLSGEELTIQLYTSSAATKTLLQQKGFEVNDIAGASSLDLYFDGCDQFDKDLNALKSGGGIHTAEKLLASMAKEFVLVGDESKYAEQLDTTYPLVLEILPQAISFVIAKVQQLFSGVKTATRHDVNNKVVITENGNYLADAWFPKWPELSQLNPILKTITGIVETSLFYNMACKAIIAGSEGVRILEK